MLFDTVLADSSSFIHLSKPTKCSVSSGLSAGFNLSNTPKCSDWAILKLLTFHNLLGTECYNHNLNFQPPPLHFLCPMLQPNSTPVSCKCLGLPPNPHGWCALDFLSTWANPTCLSGLGSRSLPTFTLSTIYTSSDFIRQGMYTDKAKIMKKRKIRDGFVHTQTHTRIHEK